MNTNSAILIPLFKVVTEPLREALTGFSRLGFATTLFVRGGRAAGLVAQKFQSTANLADLAYPPK
jgi:hypothetical protein